MAGIMRGAVGGTAQLSRCPEPKCQAPSSNQGRDGWVHHGGACIAAAHHDGGAVGLGPYLNNRLVGRAAAGTWPTGRTDDRRGDAERFDAATGDGASVG